MSTEFITFVGAVINYCDNSANEKTLVSKSSAAGPGNLIRASGNSCGLELTYWAITVNAIVASNVSWLASGTF